MWSCPCGPWAERRRGRRRDGVGPVRRVRVAALPIELGAFLKISGLAETGGEAKRLVQGGRVEVNGEPERRRARKLTAGDRVRVRLEDGGSEELLVAD
ncbi:MAG: RNA-binding S4 domain-containing protein [Firmicutes bacterium]|nr:RNA-binding S4 domain-containing protein [Bacillota bacterium]